MVWRSSWTSLGFVREAEGYRRRMSASTDPPPAPDHQCINAACGCNDLVSAGPCSEPCAANTVEMADVERGTASLTTACNCGHALCAGNRATRGTPKRGMS